MDTDAQDDDRDDQGNQAERELQQQEGEVLPGGRVREPGAQTGPPRRPLGDRPVGIGDDRAGERGDDAPLALGKQAPCVDRADQDRDADQGDREAHPERDRRHQEHELDGAEHARRDQVRDPPVGARVQQLPRQACDHSRVKSKPSRADGLYGKPYRPRDRDTMPAMAHRGAHAIMAVAAGAVVLAVAPAGAGVPDGRGKLEVAQTLAGAYDEGSVSYLRVRNGRRVVLRRSRPGPLRAGLRPRAGLYRVVSYQRPCQGNCARLDPPVDQLLATGARVRRRDEPACTPSRGPGRAVVMRRAGARGVPVGAGHARGAPVRARARPDVVRADRLARPPARLRPAPALRDARASSRRCCSWPAAPDRQPAAERVRPRGARPDDHGLGQRRRGRGLQLGRRRRPARAGPARGHARPHRRRPLGRHVSARPTRRACSCASTSSCRARSRDVRAPAALVDRLVPALGLLSLLSAAAGTSSSRAAGARPRSARSCTRPPCSSAAAGASRSPC